MDSNPTPKERDGLGGNNGAITLSRHLCQGLFWCYGRDNYPLVCVVIPISIRTPLRLKEGRSVRTTWSSLIIGPYPRYREARRSINQERQKDFCIAECRLEPENTSCD